MSSDKVQTEPTSIEALEETSSLVLENSISKNTQESEINDLISSDDDLDSLLESLMDETVAGSSSLDYEEPEVATSSSNISPKSDVSNPSKEYKTLTKLTVKTNPSVFQKLKSTFISHNHEVDNADIEDLGKREHKTELFEDEQVESESAENALIEEDRVKSEQVKLEKAKAENAAALKIASLRAEAERAEAERAEVEAERVEVAKLKLEQLTKDKMELAKRQEEQIQLDKIRQEIEKVESQDYEKETIEEIAELINQEDSVETAEYQTDSTLVEDIVLDVQDEELNEKIEVLASIKAIGDSLDSPLDPVEEHINEDTQNINYFGNNEDISDAESLESICYKPEDYMISVLLENSEEAKTTAEVIRLEFDKIVMIIDYTLNTIYCSVDPTDVDYQKLCSNFITEYKIEKRILSYGEAKTQRIQWRKNQELSHPIGTFVATSSLLTAKGRLPEGVDLTKKISLKGGFDSCVFELIPYSEEIIHKINEHSVPLLELATLTDIPQKYIFSFYNIASNLNLLDTVIELVPQEKEEKKSLFKKLFKK